MVEHRRILHALPRGTPRAIALAGAVAGIGLAGGGGGHGATAAADAPPPAARPVAVRSLVVVPQVDGLRVRYAWTGGDRFVRWSIRLSASGVDGRLTRSLRGAGAPGAQTRTRAFALSEAWAGRRVTTRLVLTDATGTAERRTTVTMPGPPAADVEPAPAPSSPPSSCDPNYAGACLDPSASDYDCAGGDGDGPRFTGYVRVVGTDRFRLDGDGDGVACEG